MEKNNYVANGPLTTAASNQYAPGLLLNEIDSRVTKIRPMATPIDQISRCGSARRAGAMKVEYYSVDTRPRTANVLEFAVGSRMSGIQTYSFQPDDMIFDESETVLIDAPVSDECNEKIVLYIVSRNDDDENYTVMVANSNPSADISERIPTGTKAVRMGRAATELDVQTPQYEALPTKTDNLCQIFKMQIEESTLQKMANKEVGWTFSDQEEVAIIDMRLGMEKSFLFGNKCRLNHPLKREEVMLTGGIWYQAGKDFSFSSPHLTEAELIDMMKEAFTGCSGSNRKVLIGGSTFIAELNKINFSRLVTAGDTCTHWGIDFDTVHSKFGTLLVKHSEVFDMCGFDSAALIIDPQYMTKYTHVPFSTERLDLRGSGQRNTEAVVVTEASCLVLRYPKAHVRVRLGE